jgi:hypothetical protein
MPQSDNWVDCEGGECTLVTAPIRAMAGGAVIQINLGALRAGIASFQSLVEPESHTP